MSVSFENSERSESETRGCGHGNMEMVKQSRLWLLLFIQLSYHNMSLYNLNRETFTTNRLGWFVTAIYWIRRKLLPLQLCYIILCHNANPTARHVAVANVTCMHECNFVKESLILLLLFGKLTSHLKNSGLPAVNHFVWVRWDSNPIMAFNSKNSRLFAEGPICVFLQSTQESWRSFINTSKFLTVTSRPETHVSGFPEQRWVSSMTLTLAASVKILLAKD